MTTIPLTLSQEDHDGPFEQYLSTARGDINEHIRLVLKDRAVPREVDAHIMRGKRLRGGLTLLSHDIMGGNDREAALDLAAAVEVAHSIGLIIDDMLDGDVERRGEKAVHVDLGAGMAMLEVMGLMSVPYALAAAHGRAAVDTLADAHHLMVRGAMSELSTSETSWDRYHTIISQKTGELFALSAAYGAMTADAGPAEVEAAREFGARCGIAYQVMDDVLDMDHLNESRGCSGPMLGRLLRIGSDHDIDARIDRLCLRRINEAREAAEAVLDLAPSADPRLRSCLCGAPVEMARMMLR